MEAGSLLRSISWKPRSSSLRRPLFPNFPCYVKASSEFPGAGYRGPKPKRDWVADWVSRNDDVVRSLPIYVGGLSLFAVLFNRAASGIAPVADASSSQSRADLLTLGLAVTNVLTGLVWLSIRPKSISMVNPQGVECRKICSNLPDYVVSEMLWMWESLSVVTCCRSLVIVYEGSCLLQIGVATESNGGNTMEVDSPKLIQGLLYQGVLKSGAQSYLANLSLYPGKSELPFLPPNTQILVIVSAYVRQKEQDGAFSLLKLLFSLQSLLAVILQPLGDKGIAIIGGDTIRGFTTTDQAWITLIAEKLDATLSRFATNLRLAMQDEVHNY